MSNRLFRQYNIFNVVEHLKSTMKENVKSMPSSALEGEVQALAKQIAANYSISVPRLEEDKRYATEREIQMDVSDDPMSQFMHGDFSGEPILISATEVTVCIPFSGDPDLFEVQPQTFSLNTPVGYVNDHELKLIFTVRQGGEDLKQQYDRAMTTIHQSLRWLSETAAQLPSQLEQEAIPIIVSRKRELEARAAAISSLGIPVRPSTDLLTSPPRVEAQAQIAKRQASQWDVFVSHASEDKDEIARPLAKALEAAGLVVWFDEKSLTLGDSLRAKIDEGLSRSRFGVIILSRHFFQKHWPQQELNGMASREVDGKKVILPVWHNINVTEVRVYSPILADRIAARTESGLDSVVEQIIRVVRHG